MLVHGSFSSSFEIPLDQLNVYHINVNKMNVSFRLGSAGGAWSQGAVGVYYSDDDYDVFATEKYQQSSGASTWSSASIEVTFRGNPIKFIFKILGNDVESGGADGYVEKLLLVE